MAEPILKLAHVVAGYDGSDVLKGVDLQIETEFDHLYRRAERGGKVDGAANDQRLDAASQGRHPF